MTTISRSALVMHSAHDMYLLVNDIERYPEFLPGCVGAKVLSLDEHEILASLKLAKIGLSTEFTTRNQLQKDRSIVLSLEKGPFAQLDGRWDFEPLSDQACKIRFHLNFSTGSKLASIAINGLFKQLAVSMVDSFTQRADRIYGKAKN